MNKLHARELSRNQPIIDLDVILQHDWLIEQCLLNIRVFFGGKTKRSCFDLFIHWVMKQITNTYRNHFSRSYETRSIRVGSRSERTKPITMRGDVHCDWFILPPLLPTHHSDASCTCSLTHNTFINCKEGSSELNQVGD